MPTKRAHTARRSRREGDDSKGSKGVVVVMAEKWNELTMMGSVRMMEKEQREGNGGGACEATAKKGRLFIW